MSSLIFFATKSGSVGRPLRTAMSASRRRKSLTSFEATTSIVMPGSMRRSFAMTGGRMNAEYASLAVMHTRPSIDCDCPEAVRDTRVAASPMARTCSTSSRPLCVNVKLRPARSNKITPNSLSSALTCRPNVGCAMPSARAAAESEPSSAVTRKARARFQSNFTDRQSMRKCISIRQISSINIQKACR